MTSSSAGSNESSNNAPVSWIGKIMSTVKVLLFDPHKAIYLHTLILLGEGLLCVLIIRFVAFTNIDWSAYMQQVEMHRKGERNYANIHGETGPLVYPAGHLWIYSLLYDLTDHGQNIPRAQYIFAVLYCLCLAAVLKLYRYCKTIPPYAACLLVLSKRLHSIYVLRLFNDGVAICLLYVSLLALCRRYHQTASMLFSLALSVKMSILLFAPAWGIVCLAQTGLVQTTFSGLAMIGIQFLIAQPFLVYDWQAYVSRAFEFSRVFKYEWTVNWRFVAEEIFLSRRFAVTLLAGHLTTLCVLDSLWCSPHGGLVRFLKLAIRSPRRSPDVELARPSPAYIITVFFSCNLAGMIFARSLHYQFYAWEALQLVYLAWQTRWPPLIKVAIIAGIDYGWEIFPSTSVSSGILLASHSMLLLSVAFHTDWEKLYHGQAEM